MTEHTPTPWEVDCDYLECVTDATDYEILECNSTDAERCFADAAFIVKAVNFFEAMVKALEEINSQAVCAVMATEDECFQMLQNCAEISDSILAEIKKHGTAP